MIEMDMPKIEVEENEAQSYAKVVVEPLEKGFGLTIGNCLRRILLSSLPGAAVQGIRFLDGSVKHEFSAVAGVKEDVTEIILNLKLLAIKTKVTDKNYSKVLHLSKEGPAVITGADIEQDSEIEIINKDQYICTVDEGGKVDLELTIGRGRGYRPAAANKKPIIDYIAIDRVRQPSRFATHAESVNKWTASANGLPPGWISIYEWRITTAPSDSSTSYAVQFRHGGRANFLFADGHVGSRLPGEYAEDAQTRVPSTVKKVYYRDENFVARSIDIN